MSHPEGDDQTIPIPAVRDQVRSHRPSRRRGLLPSFPLPPRAADTPVRRVVRSFGEVLITFGLIVLLFAGYEVVGKQHQINGVQDKYNNKLDQKWAKAPTHSADDAPPLEGGALARLYIPRFDKKLVVVQGVTQADIRNAPGHYPKSAMPGQIGNFAIAGHREDAIFPRDFQKLVPGDYLIVQTRTTWFVYQVYQQEIVKPTQVDVVNPVPDKPPGTKPTEALITLTTCNPWWDNYQRLIVHGKLVRQQSTHAGKPKELRS